jgi:hypothetical protein
MWEIYRRAKDEAGYDATRFKKMLLDRGALETARYLLDEREVSDGFTALWERHRLDLTVEAYVLRTPAFHALFTPQQLETARRRLQELGYAPP